jgi:hypothetical protein
MVLFTELGEVSCLSLFYYGCGCCREGGDLRSLRFLLEECLTYFLFLEELDAGLSPFASFARWARELLFSIGLPTPLVIETIKL